MLDRFKRSVYDSGAIIVAAASPYDHTARVDTNYGTRIDLQGWGDDVSTLGAGLAGTRIDFPPGVEDRLQMYTKTFAGTSSAAPIVTGAAVLLQAIRRARGLTDLSSWQMRELLQVGATQQGPGRLVGPLPNLRAAIDSIPLLAPAVTAAATSGTVAVSLTQVPGAASYEIYRRSSSAAPWSLLGTTASLAFFDNTVAAGQAYLYAARAADVAGNKSPFGGADLATVASFSPIAAGMIVKASHLIEIRTAINYICTLAGPETCPTPPYAPSLLNEASIKQTFVAVSHLIEARDWVLSLRVALAVAAPQFSYTPLAGQPVRVTPIDELRAAIN